MEGRTWPTRRSTRWIWRHVRVVGVTAGDAGDTPEALGAELLLGFAASAAACLHRSDSESLCSLRQATIRPPPGCTPAHSFCASCAQAARIAASVGGSSASADCAAVAAPTRSSTLKLLIANLASKYRSENRVQHKRIAKYCIRSVNEVGSAWTWQWLRASWACSGRILPSETEPRGPRGQPGILSTSS